MDWVTPYRKGTTGYAHSSRCNSNWLCHKNNDVILKISEDCEYYLTPNEVETMVKYLKSTNYNVDKLINDIKTGIIK